MGLIIFFENFKISRIFDIFDTGIGFHTIKSFKHIYSIVGEDVIVLGGWVVVKVGVT